MVKQVKIYDMDGVLVDSSWRYRTIIREDGKEVIDLQFWRMLENMSHADKLLPMAEQYKEDLQNPDVFVIIATARVLTPSCKWFIKNVLGQPNHIISRKADDNQSGTTLKVKGLKKLFGLKQFQKAEKTMHEDNASYLKGICDTLKIKGVYIPSIQGH